MYIYLTDDTWYRWDEGQWGSNFHSIRMRGKFMCVIDGFEGVVVYGEIYSLRLVAKPCTSFLLCSIKVVEGSAVPFQTGEGIKTVEQSQVRSM